MEVREFIQTFFEPRLGLRMLGFLGLYRSLFQELSGPLAVTGQGEPELRLVDDGGKKKETVVGIRPRDKGYSARISFCCSNDHGFKLDQLESALGIAVKIEPKSADCHMIRLMVNEAFDPFTPEMMEVVLQAHTAYRGLTGQ